jgi:hypothetical protein
MDVIRASACTLTWTSAHMWRRDRSVTASFPRLAYYLADGQETRGVVGLILIGPWPVFQRLTIVLARRRDISKPPAGRGPIARRHVPSVESALRYG